MTMEEDFRSWLWEWLKYAAPNEVRVIEATDRMQKAWEAISRPLTDEERWFEYQGGTINPELVVADDDDRLVFKTGKERIKFITNKGLGFYPDPDRLPEVKQ
jgi:hypothetical protein